MYAPLGRILRPPFGPRLAVVDDDSWWLTGGIPAANCIGAYQPISAADYATSKSNLANPGTYDATEGVAPTFSAVNGWVHEENDYLKSGVVPADNFSAIVRYSNAINDSSSYLFGALQATPSRYFELNPNRNGDMRFLYGDQILTISGGGEVAGVAAITPTHGYFDGVSVGNIPAYTWNAITLDIWLGIRHAAAGPTGSSFKNIQAAAFYNIDIASYVAGLTTAMNAL